MLYMLYHNLNLASHKKFINCYLLSMSIEHIFLCRYTLYTIFFPRQVWMVKHQNLQCNFDTPCPSETRETSPQTPARYGPPKLPDSLILIYLVWNLTDRCIILPVKSETIITIHSHMDLSYIARIKRHHWWQWSKVRGYPKLFFSFYKRWRIYRQVLVTVSSTAIVNITADMIASFK